MGRVGNPVMILVQPIPSQALGCIEAVMTDFFVRVTHFPVTLKSPGTVD